MKARVKVLGFWFQYSCACMSFPAPQKVSPQRTSEAVLLLLRAHCPLCCRTFVMQQIPSSNLLLLVTDRTCDCSAYSPILQEATEVKYILSTL